MARGQRSRPVVLPPMEKMVTRNRGQRQTVVPPALEKKSNGTSNTGKKRSKGTTNNRKRPWEESDDDLDMKPGLFPPSDEEEPDYDDTGDYVPPDETFESDEDDVEMVVDAKFYDDEDTIVCPWADEESYESLTLPNGSRDLFFPPGTLMDLIQIYETVVNYYNVLQVSPFIFEDFVAAIRSPEQTQLIADIHIALLKCVLRDDDEGSTQYAVTETSVSFQLITQLMDAATYGEVLRQYLDSDPRFPSDILKIVTNNYPFVPVEDKIKVLLWLCEQFFETMIFAKVIKADGKLPPNEHCRECGKPGGELIACRGCDAVYHPACNADASRSTTWLCTVCEDHYVMGVSDCLMPGEKFGKCSLRKSLIGYDRDGRIYWLIVRRIIVEDVKNNIVQFYSTLPAIFDLVSSLDATFYEAKLCRNIYKLLDVINNHCRITMDMTQTRFKEADKNAVGLMGSTYLNEENYFRMSYICWNLKHSPSQPDFKEEGTEISKDKVPQQLQAKFLHLLGFQKGALVDNFWSGGREEAELLEYRQYMIHNLGLDPNSRFIPMNDYYRENVKNTFRLSLNDQFFKNYENHYEKNEYAKAPTQRAKERDRRKYMTTKFSLDEPFQWKASKGRTILDIEALVLKFIKITLRHFIEKIPDELYHREWPKFKRGITEKLVLSAQPMDAHEIAQVMLQVEAALRKPCFMNTWWNSLGHIRLYRYNSTDREAKQAADKARAKEDRELILADQSDPTIAWVRQTKNKNPSKTLFRIKGEQYRMNGRFELGGWAWVSSMYTQDICLPEKPPLGINFATPTTKLDTPAAKKAHKLDKIVKKLTCWRESQLMESEKKEGQCFSPFCGKTSSSVDGVRTKCYSLFCQNKTEKQREITFDDTTKIVKAFDPVKRRMLEEEKNSRTFENTPGEGLPLPFPKPFNFIHPKTKRKSILVLPKYALRKLAVTGGVVAAELPGFNRYTKTNLAVWNYPCPRPLFDNCWRYMTQNVSSVHALALQLKILFSGIRWADFEPNWYADDDFRFLVQYPEYNELRTVISHQEMPPDGYYEKYQLRVEMFAEDGDGIPPDVIGDVVVKKEVPIVTISPKTVPKPTRKSDRRKSRKSNITLQLRSDTQRKVVERWINGVDLKVFEIENYWKNFNEKNRPPTPKIEVKTEPKPVKEAVTPNNQPPIRFTSSGIRANSQNLGSTPPKLIKLENRPDVVYRPKLTTYQYPRSIPIMRPVVRFGGQGRTVYVTRPPLSSHTYPIVIRRPAHQNFTYVPTNGIRRSEIENGPRVFHNTRIVPPKQETNSYYE